MNNGHGSLIEEEAMRLTAFTDYTLLALMDLAGRGGRLSTIGEIAARNGLAKNHLAKVIHQLGLAGLVRTVRGRHGGIVLARSPAAINVGAVVRGAEPDFHMAACFDAARAECPYAANCGLQAVLGQATSAYLAQLDRLTLADLLPACASSHFG